MLRGKKPPYRIVCGFRRVVALRELGVSTLKAVIRADLSDDQALRLSVLENEGASEETPIEHLL